MQLQHWSAARTLCRRFEDGRVARSGTCNGNPVACAAVNGERDEHPTAFVC